MNKEDKELQLKDLCGRLPYRPFVKCLNNDSDYILQTYMVNDLMFENPSLTIKPYFRPMSSMTEEERKELSIVLNCEFYVDDDFALVAEDDRHRICLELCKGYIDWLNENHFDYHGLIERGLALEAPEGMYKED